jgi:DNA invertase Pin-like site-specific DNA recombinase
VSGLTVSELFRLCRDLIDIHAVRDWCQARGVVLRVLSGPLSNFHDLAADDATTALIINVITAVGQFQRDLQNELTAEGIAAAEAEGRYRGRPPALTGDQFKEVRPAFRDQGASIASLAREHSEPSRRAHRTGRPAAQPKDPAPSILIDRWATHIRTMDDGYSVRTGSLSPLAVRLLLTGRLGLG